MKRNFFKIISVACIIFLLLGIGTILKGDIENTKEAMIMAVYLLFFSYIILVIRLFKVENKNTGKY